MILAASVAAVWGAVAVLAVRRWLPGLAARLREEWSSWR